MATKKDAPKTFSDFLKDAPTAEEMAAERTVKLVGTVVRTDSEDEFVLMTDGGTVRLKTEAVKSFEVVQEAGPRQVVQLEVGAEQLGPVTGPTIKELTKDPVTDIGTFKEAPKDPISDTFKEVPKDPINDTFKEPTTDPLVDTTPFSDFGTNPLADPNTGPFADPTTNPLADPNTNPLGDLGTNPLADPGTTPFSDPNTDPRLDTFKNPGEGVFAPGSAAVPFVMATPHHAAGAAEMMRASIGVQPQAAANVGAVTNALTVKELTKDPIQDPITLKEAIKDPIQDPITIKELTKDPIQDPITLKELTKDPIQDPITLVEGIDPRGPVTGPVVNPGVNPIVWNLPGLMF